MYLPAADATASLPDWLHLPLPFCGGSDDCGGILFDVPRNGATLKMQIGPYREPTRCRLSPFSPRGLFQYRLLRDAFIPHGVLFLLVYRGQAAVYHSLLVLLMGKAD